MFHVAARMLQPGTGIRREVRVLAEHRARCLEFLELNQKTLRAGERPQRVVGLHPVRVLGRHERVCKGRHAEVGEDLSQRGAAEAALGRLTHLVTRAQPSEGARVSTAALAARNRARRWQFAARRRIARPYSGQRKLVSVISQLRATYSGVAVPSTHRFTILGHIWAVFGWSLTPYIRSASDQ